MQTTGWNRLWREKRDRGRKSGSAARIVSAVRAFSPGALWVWRCCRCFCSVSIRCRASPPLQNRLWCKQLPQRAHLFHFWKKKTKGRRRSDQRLHTRPESVLVLAWSWLLAVRPSKLQQLPSPSSPPLKWERGGTKRCGTGSSASRLGTDERMDGVHLKLRNWNPESTFTGSGRQTRVQSGLWGKGIYILLTSPFNVVKAAQTVFYVELFIYITTCK